MRWLSGGPYEDLVLMDLRLMSVAIPASALTRVSYAVNGLLNAAMSAPIRLSMSRSSLFHVNLKAVASISRSWETSRYTLSAILERNAIDFWSVSSK